MPTVISLRILERLFRRISLKISPKVFVIFPLGALPRNFSSFYQISQRVLKRYLLDAPGTFSKELSSRISSIYLLWDSSNDSYIHFFFDFFQKFSRRFTLHELLCSMDSFSGVFVTGIFPKSSARIFPKTSKIFANHLFENY